MYYRIRSLKNLNFVKEKVDSLRPKSSCYKIVLYNTSLVVDKTSETFYNIIDMKKINILEGIDRTFLSCLEEIMHSYSCLDKQGRLRVEQWVQKLASVPLSPPSSNRTVREFSKL